MNRARARRTGGLVVVGALLAPLGLVAASSPAAAAAAMVTDCESWPQETFYRNQPVCVTGDLDYVPPGQERLLSYGIDQQIRVDADSNKDESAVTTGKIVKGVLDLTIKDVTKPVTIVFEETGEAVDPFGNTRVGFEGKATINRKDWGLTWNAALEAGGVLVSEKVGLEFDISAIRQQG